MNEVLFHLRLGGIEVVVTAWKIVGYIGTLMFAGRWVVQFIATRAAGRPVMPRAGEPWINPQDYARDKKMFAEAPVDDGVMQFRACS